METFTPEITGYAVQSATTPVEPHRFTRRAPRANDVIIDILYCGVCHSDIHQARNDWGNSIYPMVPGHEIIGRVTGVGGDVTRFKQGDMVGVGCMVDSCLHCEACLAGLEQYCENYATLTYNDRVRLRIRMLKRSDRWLMRSVSQNPVPSTISMFSRTALI